MGTCYSVQGKGELRPYITVKPLSRESPILQGEPDTAQSSPVKADLEPPPKSVLKNSPNWSRSSSPLFEKKVQHQVSFDLMTGLELPLSASTSTASSPRHQQQEAVAAETSAAAAGSSDQSKANGGQSKQILRVRLLGSCTVVCWCMEVQKR